MNITHNLNLKCGNKSSVNNYKHEESAGFENHLTDLVLYYQHHSDNY